MPEQTVPILRALLEAGSDYVSGSRLARELGVSRVSIWGRLERLREEGFCLEATRNRGYRLTGEPAHLHPALLAAHLQLGRCSTNLLYLEEVDSTNSEAERQIAAGAQTPLVIVAARQSRGRGRLGRAWYSADTGNLYTTFVFRPNLPPARMPKFTLWMGVSLCALLNERFGIPARVKWPNDLVIGGKKVAGMLTEARIDADHTRDLIFGLGLNIAGDLSAFPEEVRAIATSLSEAAGKVLPVNGVTAQVVTRALEGYEEFVTGRYEVGFRGMWERYDALRGREVTAQRHQNPVTGVACGLDESGALLLRRADGKLEAIQAGDVTLSKVGVRAGSV